MKTFPTSWTDQFVCAECGKEICMLYPHLWAYKNGKKNFCSWHCLRADEAKGENIVEKLKKDGTPAKKPGRKPQTVIEKDLDNVYEAEQKEQDTVMHEFAEDGVHLKKVTKPLAYDGFDVTAIKGEFGRYGRDTFNGTEYFDFETNDGEEISMPVEAWKDFLTEVFQAAKVLGVEL